ncbi:zinc-ribbon domain-containing protein [Mogibacterium diversum]|uniref:zinc-ribbon domain-containing protein n=1 Tax=Mogibacterium diversum TaxID=114527 RepID=UPI0023528EBD|nr:zinc-ribbon domain-containing protein [Mogibacterium diversum]
MFCSNCGNEVAEGAKFCSVCGARLSLDAEPSVHEHTAFSSSNREGNMMDKRESSTKFDFNFGSEDLEIKEPKKKTSSVSFDWSSVIEESHKKPTKKIRSPWETTGIDDEEAEAVTQSFSSVNNDWDRHKTAEPAHKAEEPDSIEEILKRDSAAVPASGHGRTMNFIEVMKQEKEEREKAAKEAEEASVSADSDFSGSILPNEEREHTQGYTELKDDIVAELEKQASEMDEKEVSHRLDAASADFDEYLSARRKSHEEVFQAEPPHNFVDDMVHVSAADTRDEFKLPEDEFETELSAFIGNHEDADKEDVHADKSDDDLFNFDIDIEDTDEDEETVSQYLDYVKPSRVSRAQERAEAEEFDLDDEDDDDEPETFSYDELTDDNKEPETDYELEPGTESTEEADDFAFGDDDIDVPYEEPVNYSELYMDEETEKADKPAALETDEVVDSHETSDEAATEVVPAVSETSTEPKEPEEPVATEIAAEPVSEPTAEIASKPSLAEPVNAASETVEVASAPAEKAEDAELAAAKAIESEIANLQKRLAELLGKDTSETVELPAREVVSAEELVQEPVQAKAEAETEANDTETGARSDLTSLEAELAALGFDTIDDEPDEEADMLFSAEDVADANTSAVEENNEDLNQEEVMSIDDLQKDLFGTDVDDAGMEATRKIDKFYTLYRKNEEFQQLLDEEYKKLQDGSADYTLMEDVLADYQDEEEAEETPVEAHHETVEAAVKAESAKLEAAKKDAGSELSNSANVTEPITAATTLVSSPAQAAVNTASKASSVAPSVVDDDDEESRKGGVLTVIAVIVAILLVLLLVVILILNFAPDSSVAQRISEVIGKFTNFASLGDNSELLL